MVASAPKPRQSRLDGLQWGRAIAALLVVACHSIVHPLPELPKFAVYIGDIGVTIFFVISGFIMVTTTGRGQFDPWLFMRRRLVRVVPLYYLAIMVVVFFALFLPNLMKSTQFDLQHLIMSLLFIPTYAPTGGILPIYKLGWTLNFEMFFYLVFAALSFLTLRRRIVSMLGLFGLLALLGVVFTFTDAIPEFYTRPDVMAFAAGAVIAYLKDWRHWSIPALPGLAISAIGIVVLCAVFVIYGSMRVSPVGHFTSIAACAGLVAVLAAVENGGNSRISRFGILLGDASYALYLFHIFVVAGVWWVAGLVFGPVDPAFHILVIGVAMIVSVAASLVVHIVLERPMTRYLTDLVAPRPKPAPVAS